MSDGDVSLIQDEDLLRRMWQQTEDFSRKKEIRAHMYRLREERLRNLYSPEPKHDGKGSEFTAAQDHVKSFADQSFQSMKSKEVRDAGSPPKEFTYRGQDLKALSNAGWNVEQENKTTDDGRTHVKSINANIEGRYDVDGGKGQFAAVDHHKEAVTEYHDDNSSLKHNETSSNTAAREHVVRQTDDGTHVLSTTNSSTSTSKVQQMSSTRHESVPYTTNDDYDPRSYDTNRNDNASSVTRRQITKTNDYEQNLRNNEYEQTLRQNDYETGELVSRKVDYPDDNTRVIVETRCLPDGTRVTSTKREFRAPVQSTRAEQVYQTRSENRSYSTQQRSNKKDSSKVIHHVIDNRDYHATDIVDSQRNVDDYDFNKQVADKSTRDTDNYSNTQHYERKVNKRVIDHSKTDHDYSNIQRTTKINRSVVNDDNSNIQRNVTKINKTVVDNSKTDDDYSNIQRYQTTTNKKTTDSSKTDDNYSQIHHETNVNQRIVDHSKTDDDYNQTTRYVTKTHKIIESNDNDDYVQTHRETNQQRYDTTDDEHRKVVITHDNHNIHEKDYKDVQSRDTEPRSSKPRETSTPTEYYPRDSQPSVLQPQNTQPKDIQPKSTEKIVNITRNEKVEEIIENKTNTEQRQTTYQTDFSHKKISNDWSPSHTAWASTLRGDTPSTTRPSTRASSPGSKTFKSSTSSLRSSVSPDKTNRKPPSRGSSPNKVERSSPTRPVPDQHYTTHSTHSVTEFKSHKYSTPDERRPPTGRHPSGGRYSPERKPQDHRQRPSVSPEKRPQDLVYRSSVSPDRKPTIKSPTDSPVNRVDRQSPTRPRESPERKLPQHPSSVSGYPSSPNRSTISPEKAPADHHPKHQTTRPTQSPDRKPGFQKPVDGRPQTRGFHPPDTTQKHDRPRSPTTKDTTPNRGSVSPDRKPGYMTPTASSQPTDVRKSPTKPSEKISPTKQTSFSSPTRKPQDHTAPYKKYQEDHYKFIDEETKMYTRTDKTHTDTTKRTPKGSGYSSQRDNSPSPTRKSPIKDTEGIRKVPGKRSPSPNQQTDVEKHDRVDTTVKTTDVTDNITTTYNPKNMDSLRDKTVPKQLSPSKPGAQDKTRPSTETPEEMTRNKISSPTEKIPSKDSDFVRKFPGRRSLSPKERATTTEKHDRFDTSTKTSKVTDNVITTYQSPKDKDSPRDQTVPRQSSPTKFGTYDKKKPHTDTSEQITREKSPSPTRRSPSKDTDVIRKVAGRRSPSPNERITAAEKHNRVDTTIKTSKVTDDVIITYQSPNDKDSPRDKTVPRQASPTKFGTYDKKKPHTDTSERIRREKNPSPTRRSPSKDTDINRKVAGRRSPSPKERITAAEKHNRVDTTIKTSKVTDDVITSYQSPKDKDSPRDKNVPRQASPSKFGTYDKKKSHTDTPEEITREKSPSSTRRSPGKDTDVIRKVPGRRSPSPRERITADVKHDHVDTTIKISKVTDNVITTYESPKDNDSPRDQTEPRQLSPTKFVTYDKKKPHTDTSEQITREKSPSPTRRSPSKDTDFVRKVPGRSPSPKRLVTKTEKQNRNDTTIKTNDVIDTFTTSYSSPKDMDAARDKTDPREPSPSKFGTYDKRRPYTETTEIITTTKDIKYDSLKRGKSPKKSPEQSVSPTRKTPELPGSPIKKVPERPTSPSKKIPRDSVSPVKSPTKNTKYTHTTDFLTSERTTEEVNKKTTKEHPRQLVTPSSSPTRKPKRPTDPEPSTGQSSPTTSVSGFVYFSSPRTEETVVTDLDDQESYTEIHSLDETITTSKRPESFVTQRSPSPSKIPCRSPSPERHTSPPKDSLPRKSSLKKPVTDTTQASPVEKPPTSFRVSPTEEPKELPGHKVLKKDHADEPKTKAPIKSKPPLERRETYDDRCRKILGMTEDTSETVTKPTSYFQEPETNTSSPSISPCRSPAPKDTPFEYPTTKKVTDTNVDVMDFIKHEQENIVHKIGKTPYKTSRDSSPTKLQDIIKVKKTVIESDVSTTDIEEIDVKKSSTTEYPEARRTPQRKSQTVEDTPSNISKHIPTPCESPERPSHQKQKDTEFVRSTSPAKLHPGSSPRSSSSPERKPKYAPKDKTQLKEPKDKTLGFIETTTTISTKYDTDEDTEQITVTTKKTGKKPSSSSDSRMRKIPGDTISQPKELVHDEPSITLTRPSYLESTISMVAEYGSTEDLVESVQESIKTQLHPSQPSKPTTKPSQRSPSRTPNQEQPSKVTSNKKTGNKPKDLSPTRPSYTKSSVISKYESTTENVKEASVSEGVKHKTIHSKISETSPRKTPKEVDDFEPDHPSDKTSNRKPLDTQEKPLQIRNSTEQKPNDKYAEDLSPTNGTPKKVPSYMKTTKSTTSKNDTISAEDYEETNTLKTGRHHPSKSSESPTRKTDKSGDCPHSTVRSQDTDKGSDVRPSHKLTPTANEKSPDRYNTKKTPHYMTPVSAHSHIHETETTTEDEYEQRTSTEYETLQRSDSPTHLSTRDTPHYMQSIPPHRHTHGTISSVDLQETRIHELKAHKPQSEKTPHYMTPMSSHLHKHETITTEEDIETSTVMEERHPSGDKFPESDYPHTGSRTHPTASDILTKQSPERKSLYQQPSEQNKKFAEKNPEERSPTKKIYTSDTPGYIKTSTTTTSKHDTTDDYEETTLTESTKRRYESPTRKTPTHADPPKKPYHKDDSPNRKLKDNRTQNVSPDRKSSGSYRDDSSPRRRTPVDKTPDYMRTTTSITSKYDSTTEDVKEQVSLTTEKHHLIPRQPSSPSVQKGPKHTPDTVQPVSPSKPYPDSSIKKPSMSKDVNKKESSPSPDRKASYRKPTASVTSKNDIINIENIETTELKMKHTSLRSSVSPSRVRSPDELSRPKPGYLKEPEEPRQLRTPSPSKKSMKVTEVSTDFLMSEREQEILDRVQKSLRKLSPERKEKSPSRERSPEKTTTSLQDIDINTTTQNQMMSEKVIEFTKKQTSKTDFTSPGKLKEETPKDQKVPSKPSSRNTSPTKKPSGIASPTKIDKGPESTSKPRSISPKKPISSAERPQSPLPKASGIKPKEQIPSYLTRKPTPATLATTKVEKTTSDLKKTTGVTTTKQNSFTKVTTSKTTTKSTSSPTGRPSEPRTPTPKGIRESGIPKKEIDTKVTRTVSDITIKSKKSSPTSPQRMKSKPDIQVSDMSTLKSKPQKSTLKEPQSKLPGKPKSATTLNTPSDEDDIIIDVQQSKSSRENSPDRICPTPVNFGDDVGIPRYPDEVKEPEDEFRKRTHHIIHETESIVDDIVEICEDDELFIRKSDIEHLTEEDESLLTVTDKVTKFTKGIDTTSKPKDTTNTFKDTERRVHSDFAEKNLQSDECLLSVSEKVNKFAKGPRDIKDKSPARRVVDEYDKNTVYTDDYTKLSVHDKAHLFVETAENVRTPKTKPAPQRVERPDLTNVDEALKSDDCLLSVSDKVHKFVKTAEQFLTETQEVDEKEKKIKEQHEIIMKKIVDDVNDDMHEIEETTVIEEEEVSTKKIPNRPDDKASVTKVTSSSYSKVKDNSSPYLNKPSERPPTVKITTLRSSEAVKKAKALFETIASTTPKTRDATHAKTTTKLTDIGVTKKSPKTDSTKVLHPSVEEVSCYVSETDTEVSVPIQSKERPSSGIITRPHLPRPEDKPRASPTRLTMQSPDGRRSKSPMRHTVETTTTTKTMLTKYPTNQRPESPKNRPESNKPEKVPGYLRPTKTSQIKEEPKVVEEKEVSSRRGSGKFGVELRRTSVERSTVSSERRRSVEHPCIEDIFDLDLLEQMLEKVVGYEQRRRIRAQIRTARKMETEHVGGLHTAHTRTTKQITITQKDRSSERHQTRSPDRAPKTKPHKTASPDRQTKTPQRTILDRSQPIKHDQLILNGHGIEPVQIISDKRSRPQSPTKVAPKSALKTKSPIRPVSPDKKTRTQSPSKTASPKPKANRFNEYAFAYMKKVGLNEAEKLKFTESKKKTTEEKHKTVKQVEEHEITEEFSTSKKITERSPSEEVIEVTQMNGSKRSPSPEKRQSPERKSQSRERFHERTPSPDKKQPTHHTKLDPLKKETIIKTVYEIEKKIPQKQTPEHKPSWVTERNLKKITPETRTYSSKKIEEKPRYRVPSPSKVISKPIDVITSSYGPGPLDAEGKPLFGIKALRNGASNYQVKGTVIRQEYHSRNGSEPEGTVSVTAYSTEPEELEQLLQRQGEQPSRIHGLAAITTTKKFGGDTGTTLKEIHGKEERAAIDQFTHSDRRVSDTRIEDINESFSSRQEITGDTRRIETRKEEIVGDIITDRADSKTDRMQKRVERGEKVERRGDRLERKERPDDKKTVRQSSVKSLTEKYIKSANEGSKAERPAYPKAGLILRTATMKDSVSSDSSAHAGLARTDSEHSLGSVEDTVVTTERCEGGVRTITTTTRSHGHVTHSHHEAEPERVHTERSFLDSNTKVSGVQDILTRMKNADIVIQEGDTSEDTEARALLNKFLGATVLMAGMQSYVTEKPSGKVVVKQETVRTSSNSGGKVTSSQTRSVQEFDIDQCWDERVLRKLLDECNDYEQRRRLRARIRTLMAEQEACASAVTEALAAAGEAPEDNNEAREEEEVTVTSSVRRNSSEKTVSSSTTTTKTSKVIDSMTRPAPKPVSPFAKFRQLEKQNSTNSPKM